MEHLQNVESIASAVARPIVKDVTLDYHWKLTCSDTVWECFGELIFFLLLVVALSLYLARRCYRDQKGTELESESLVKMEEGIDEVVDEEEIGERRSKSPGSSSLIANVSSQSLEEGGTPGSDDIPTDGSRPVPRTRNARRPGHRRSSSGDRKSRRLGGFSLDVDDYAPLSYATGDWLSLMPWALPRVPPRACSCAWAYVLTAVKVIPTARVCRWQHG